MTVPPNRLKRGSINDNTLPKIEIDKKSTKQQQSQQQQQQDDHSNYSSLNSANSAAGILPSNLPPRRIWVKKANGTPTTVLTYINDLVDDLKVAIVNKYPNSIGRFDDAADIVIKMDATNLRTPVSPSMARINSNTRSYDNFLVLEPDQNVWQFLDNYFPNGMTMTNALTIDTPTFSSDPTPISRSGSQQHQQPPPSQQQASQAPQAPQPQQHERHLSLSGYSFNRGQGVKHPQPVQPNSSRINNYKLYPTSRQNYQSNNLVKDRSVSPSTLASRMSPVSHKRSYSNPVYSPHQVNNPSAVLLLPKNFSLEKGDNGTVVNDTDNNNTNTNENDNENENETENEAGGNENDTFDDKENFNDKITKSKHKPTPLPLAKMNNLTTKNNSSIANTPKSGDPTTDKVLPSISVLVVEDNAINQAILGAFLRKRKIQYKIAKNGQEAIDKWKEGGFHLVLMDIQLPVKSGIEATKEIRYLEKLNKIGVFDRNELTKYNQQEIDEKDKLNRTSFTSPVIIVALTASSNSSIDRKNALTAGCNDYLTKPVNLVWLQNKITEWGCMQALIDFDGWKDKSRRLNKTG
ncbi:SSK1 Oxidative stress response two-component system protein SSK1 [Candida maltosa Xu316]